MRVAQGLKTKSLKKSLDILSFNFKFAQDFLRLHHATLLRKAFAKVVLYIYQHNCSIFSFRMKVPSDVALICCITELLHSVWLSLLHCFIEFHRFCRQALKKGTTNVHFIHYIVLFNVVLFTPKKIQQMPSQLDRIKKIPVSFLILCSFGVRLRWLFTDFLATGYIARYFWLYSQIYLTTPVLIYHISKQPEMNMLGSTQR